MLHDNWLLFSMSDTVQAKARLFGETSRNHQLHAGHPGGLAGGSGPGIQASL